MSFNLFDVWVCFIDFGLMTQQDGRIVKKRIGTVDLSKNQKLESVNWKIKEKCFIFIKLDCHFDEIRYDRSFHIPGELNGITWVMGKTLAISQTENWCENYWTSSNQRKCSGKKNHIFFAKNLPIFTPNDYFPKCPIKMSFWNMVILGHFDIQNLEFLNYFFPDNLFYGWFNLLSRYRIYLTNMNCLSNWVSRERNKLAAELISYFHVFKCTFVHRRV